MASRPHTAILHYTAPPVIGGGEAVIKLADFGLARVMMGDAELTFAGAFVVGMFSLYVPAS